MIDKFEVLARDGADVPTVRAAIWKTLAEPSGHRTVYAVLCRWTWRALLERRLDGELRSWHRLLLDSASRILADDDDEPRGTVRSQIDRPAAAERLRALADLVRLSVDAADASDVKDLASRAHVVSLLRLLARQPDAFAEREQLREGAGLRDANLSRILTLLAANGLIEREARGRIAAFKITRRGLDLVAEKAPRNKIQGETHSARLVTYSRPRTQHTKHYEPLLIEMAVTAMDCAGGADRTSARKHLYLNGYESNEFFLSSGDRSSVDIGEKHESKRMYGR